MSQHSADTFDAAVIGGGPAGTAAAVTLARSGCSVLLLEAEDQPTWKIGETLAPEAHQVLRQLGLHSAAERASHLASPGIRSAWGDSSLADKDFILSPHGCAWQVDRAEFEEALRQQADAEGVCVWRGTRFENAERQEEVWHISVADRHVRAGWLIDATGRRSAVGRLAGASRVVVDQLVAIHALLQHPAKPDRDGRTYVEAAPDGWWYSALTPDGRRIVAYQTDADLASAVSPVAVEWFRECIGQSVHMRELLDRYGYEIHSTPKLTSAHSGRLTASHGPGWLAVGDAAQSFDPLSGQGMYHALVTGYHGAKALAGVASLSRSESDGPPGPLAGYGDFLHRTWQDFIAHRLSYYRAESRWAEREFWKRRQSAEAGA